MIRRAALLAVLAVSAAAPLRAQVRDSVPGDSGVVEVQVDAVTGRVIRVVRRGVAEVEDSTAFTASPPLPEDHWAVRAAWRAEGMGLARFLPAERAVPRAEVARALRQAASAARTPAQRRLTAAWLARFVEEFPDSARAPAPGDDPRFSAAVMAGFDHARGRLAPANGYPSGGVPRQDPWPLPDVSAPRLSARASALIGPGSAELAPTLRGGRLSMRTWDLSAGGGAWEVSLGREPVGFGFGRTGGVVLSDPDPLGRLEVQTARPIHLPWILRALGPTTADVFAGLVQDSARFPTKPDIWGMRVAVQPHPRVTFAVNRASIFGGDSVPATPLRLVKMFLGVVHSDFENQVASGELRYRVPTERILPLTAYVEWGADDAAGAIQSVPGRVIGLSVPALPGAPEAGAGVEYTFFKHACCGHGPWYFNATFPGDWVLHGRPLGHPLGGEGAEYAAYANADLLDARLRIDARAFIADRSTASLARYGGGNLFAPERAGRSHGGAVHAAWRLTPKVDLDLRGQFETGAGWREHDLQALAAWYF